MRVPAEFSRALREALRRLHETSKLAGSALLSSRVVDEQASPDTGPHARVKALQDLLRAAVAALADNARTEPLHRALLHTYVDPAPTQLLAAEKALTSFGTYRRHLAGGLEELATTLWLREQALSPRRP